MSNTRKQAALAAAAGATAIAIKSGLYPNLRLAVQRWHDQPAETAMDIGLSFVGQIYFWTVGQDFIGIGMDKKWGPGLGHLIAPRVQRRLPDTDKVAWILKMIEIASDATKMPLEGKIYRELGLDPDSVATGVTQPAWSLIEVLEKLYGVATRPERVTEPGQVADSISSIYGTWTRHLLSLWLLRYGERYRTFILSRLSLSKLRQEAS